MRILYIDIDSSRPDHFGCYGYHRNTTPNVDRIAEQGAVFTNCYAPDAPCLPSRTALYSGRHGIRTGVMNHGGARANPYNEGLARNFRDSYGMTSFPQQLRNLGLHTATISPFGNRHSAWHWYAGMAEIHDTGGGGKELADVVTPVVLDWVNRRAKEDNWYLHVNYWDPHTEYRTPAAFGDPFANDPLPAWYTEDIRQQHWSEPGPHSAQEVNGFFPDGKPDAAPVSDKFPRQPSQISSMDEARKMFDGYDTGLRYTDDHIGRILNALADQGVLEDTVVIISGDHGENLGELNVYGDHQTADRITSNVPMIIKWPGLTKPGQKYAGKHYNFDFAATILDLLGGVVPENWDGESFAPALKKGKDTGRDYVVTSQCAWTAQRGVHWDDWCYLRTYHCAYHGYPTHMLFNLADDPHQTHNLADERTDLVNEGIARLEAWITEKTADNPGGQDPIKEVLAEGGPLHARMGAEPYLARLRETGRAGWADFLAERYGNRP